MYFNTFQPYSIEKKTFCLVDFARTKRYPWKSRDFQMFKMLPRNTLFCLKDVLNHGFFDSQRLSIQLVHSICS